MIDSRDARGNTLGVVITSDPEGPVQFVLDLLAARGDEVVFIDPSRPESYRISLGTTAGSTILETEDGQRARIDEDARIWLRRPELPDESRFRSHDPDTRRYQERAYRAAWSSIYSMPACWMNDAASARALEVNKPFQSSIASAAGLNTIPTLLTDDASHFSAFAQSFDGDVAVKSPVSWHRTTQDSDETLATYTRRLTTAEALTLAPQVVHAPVVVQPYVEKLYELRITVVGSQMFACRIDSQSSDQTNVDWRHYDLENVRHESIELPSEITAGLSRFMSKSGLKFAAIDMIVDLDGRYVFVEANPSGHYSWIESLTGMPISRSIADWLIGRAS